MPNLNVTESRPSCLPGISRCQNQFYQDLGFTLGLRWRRGVAYFHLGNASFLLQDGNPRAGLSSFMMHLLVEDVAAWQAGETSQVAARYGVRVPRSSSPSRGA